MKKKRSSSRNHNARLQRNMKERERRMKMKHLYSQLASVVHAQPLKVSVPELVDQTTSYVNHLHERMERLKKQKAFYDSIFDVDSSVLSPSPKRLILDVRSWDSSTVEVNLICGSENKTSVFDCFRIFQEEGAEVVNFTSHSTGDNVIYTMRAQAIIMRIGIETSRIQERLKELIP